MVKLRLVNDQIYHVYNRGVDKRDIFIKDEDRLRFIHDLYEFNDEAPALNIRYKQSHEVQLREHAPRSILVEILAFCMMKNHYHFLLRQKVDNGIVRFMHKLGTGYTNYFNSTYERTGALFQGRYKIVLVDNESHLLHLPYYVHTNPISLIYPDWKEGNFDIVKVMQYLRSYRWSSFLDYIGKKNFPSIIQKDFLKDYLYGNIESETGNWLRNIKQNLAVLRSSTS